MLNKIYLIQIPADNYHVYNSRRTSIFLHPSTQYRVISLSQFSDSSHFSILFYRLIRIFTPQKGIHLRWRRGFWKILYVKHVYEFNLKIFRFKYFIVFNILLSSESRPMYQSYKIMDSKRCKWFKKYYKNKVIRTIKMIYQMIWTATVLRFTKAVPNTSVEVEKNFWMHKTLL